MFVKLLEVLLSRLIRPYDILKHLLYGGHNRLQFWLGYMDLNHD